MWNLSDYAGTPHTLPEAHFNPDQSDYTGLRAQAHLILGARYPHYIGETDDTLQARENKKNQHRLDHLQQVIEG